MGRLWGAAQKRFLVMVWDERWIRSALEAVWWKKAGVRGWVVKSIADSAGGKKMRGDM